MRLLRYGDLGPEKGIWYSRTHLRRISDPSSEWYQGFPAPRKMGCRVGWDDAEVDAWLASRPRQDPPPASDEEQD
jgi:hypothetical protein